jgi:hypothetical protein
MSGKKQNDLPISHLLGGDACEVAIGFLAIGSASGVRLYVHKLPRLRVCKE